MKRKIIPFYILVLLITASSCSSFYGKTNLVVPITYEQEIEIGNSLYNDLMQASKTDSKIEDINKVHDIASRIAKIANLYTDVRCNEKSTVWNQLFKKMEKLIDEGGDIRKVNLKFSRNKSTKCYYDWNVCILEKPSSSSSIIKSRSKISNLPIPNSAIKISNIKLVL